MSKNGKLATSPNVPNCPNRAHLRHLWTFFYIGQNSQRSRSKGRAKQAGLVQARSWKQLAPLLINPSQDNVNTNTLGYDKLDNEFQTDGNIVLKNSN